MQTPYSNFRTVQEFAENTKGMSLEQLRHAIATERENLTAFCELPLRKQRPYLCLAEYDIGLWLLDRYLESGQMPAEAHKPTRAALRSTMEEIHKRVAPTNPPAPENTQPHE
jgi:hypothetical protein